MTTLDLVTKKLDAELHAAEARMEAIEADARARKAREEMETIAGIRQQRERARERMVELQTSAAADVATRKEAAKKAIHEFEVAVERASEQFLAWDAARNAHLNARLDEAGAQLREWKAMVQIARTEEEIRERKALAKLEEKIALAKAKAAEWAKAQHESAAAEAARDAARHFDEAYKAAVEQYTLNVRVSK